LATTPFTPFLVKTGNNVQFLLKARITFNQRFDTAAKTQQLNTCDEFLALFSFFAEVGDVQVLHSSLLRVGR
jgi:hypothetical protein